MPQQFPAALRCDHGAEERVGVQTHRGEVVLRLRAEDKACVHLRGTLCGIYTLRPDNCSVFPAGSEPCLGSRKEEFDIDD